MKLMVENWQQLDRKDNHWVKFFNEHPRERVKIVRYGNKDSDSNYLEAAKYFEELKIIKPGSLGLLAPLGFTQNGWVYRDLNQKLFVTQVFGSPMYYAAQWFCDRLSFFKFGDPVVVCEGVLDAECLVELTGYPYVIAQVGSSMSVRLGMMMSLITDKIVLVPDNDKAGEAGAKKSLFSLKQLGVKGAVVTTASHKDTGELWLNGSTVDRLIFKKKLGMVLEGMR
jgi:hypothetical protein